jgi:hypothetical protein
MRWFCVLAIGLVAGLLIAYPSSSGISRAPRSTSLSASTGFQVRNGGADDGADKGTDGDDPATEKTRTRRKRSRAAVNPSTPETLAKQRGWIDALNVYWRLPGVEKPGRRERHLQRALAKTTAPLPRQNLIFLIALTVPWEQAEPRLREIAAAGSDGDREDVLVALAFSGMENELAQFLALSRAPEPVPARRLVNTLGEADAIAAEDTPEARAFLRSYRAIEVLDRDPYFDRTVLRAHWSWTDHPRDVDRVTAELLPAWLDRYPGHPGSDDMAWRLGRRAAGNRQTADALRWLSRATVLPDQRWTTKIMLDLISVAEQHATPEILEQVANEDGFDTANRELLQYIRVRRTAAERGVEDGLRLAAALARDEPDSELARAWRQRYAAKAPRGLDSGLKPLPDDDPLRRVKIPRGTFPKAIRITRNVYIARDLTEEQQLNPPRNALPLSGALLAHQFRIWETLAALRKPGRGADAHYKAAAVLYHETDAFYPIYLRHDFNAGNLVMDRPDDKHPEWARDHVSPLRALEAFRDVERNFPNYAGMDKVLYSQGLSLRKIQDARELDSGASWAYTPEQYRVEEAKALIGAFEECAARFPDSDLAPSATNAARWWRRRVARATR